MIIILCVDRDNDIGRKAGIEGPIIGRENNLEAAKMLALADPEDSDLNALFMALKIFDETSKKEQVEIVTVTGHSKQDYLSDKKIAEQLKIINESFHPEGFILVSDGAEDEQIIPLIMSYGKIISVKDVRVKQARAVESAYYAIKEALKDPAIARTIFGIPGIIFLVYALTLYFNIPNLFFQGISFILGIYLLLKGFGIESIIIKSLKHFIEGISLQKASFPFYIAALIILIFGIVNSYNNFLFGSKTLNNMLNAIQGIYFFIAMAVSFIVIGRIIDLIQEKRAIELRKYLLYSASIFVLWLIIDSATLVILRQADLNFFLISVLTSFIILIICFKLAELMDLRKKVSKILENLPVYSKQGFWLGKVKSINKITKEIIVKTKEKDIIVKEGEFILKNDRIILG